MIQVSELSKRCAVHEVLRVQVPGISNEVRALEMRANHLSMVNAQYVRDTVDNLEKRVKRLQHALSLIPR